MSEEMIKNINENDLDQVAGGADKKDDTIRWMCPKCKKERNFRKVVDEAYCPSCGKSMKITIHGGLKELEHPGVR